MKKCVGTVAYPITTPMAWDDFGFSFAQMVQFTQETLCKPGEYLNVARSTLGIVGLGRNDLVKKMRGDWLFQTDADHQFEPDVLLRMLDRLDRYSVDVVVGLYVQRQIPHAPLLYVRMPGGYFQQAGEWPKEPFKVDGAGAGCLLVKRSVFERIFEELDEEPFAPSLDFPGEDLAFFDRLHRLNVSVLCDPRIEHPHLGVKGMTSADFAHDRVQLVDA